MRWIIETYFMEILCQQFDRERLLSRLKDLKNYYVYRHNKSTDWKKNLLTHLNLALVNLSLTNKPLRGRAIKSCTIEEELDNKVRGTQISRIFLSKVAWLLLFFDHLLWSWHVSIQFLQKLNSRMLHGTRNLAEEKQLFKDMNMCQKRDEASTSPPPELMKSVKYLFIIFF